MGSLGSYTSARPITAFEVLAVTVTTNTFSYLRIIYLTTMLVPYNASKELAAGCLT